MCDDRCTSQNCIHQLDGTYLDFNPLLYLTKTLHLFIQSVFVLKKIRMSCVYIITKW